MTVLYRVEKVFVGDFADRTVLVVHRCPTISSSSPRARLDDAVALRRGQRHVLTLSPYEGSRALVTDHFLHDQRPRYEALATDRSRWAPRITVVVSGGGGTNCSLEFNQTTIVAGRASDADVLLNYPGIAPRHLRLEVKGQQIEVSDLSATGSTLLNGRRLDTSRSITFRDRLSVGPYVLRAALLPDGD